MRLRAQIFAASGFLARAFESVRVSCLKCMCSLCKQRTSSSEYEYDGADDDDGDDVVVFVDDHHHMS